MTGRRTLPAAEQARRTRNHVQTAANAVALLAGGERDPAAYMALMRAHRAITEALGVVDQYKEVMDR